jgi:hypothetical protein
MIAVVVALYMGSCGGQLLVKIWIETAVVGVARILSCP